MARAAIPSKKVMIAPEPPKKAKPEEQEIPIEPITFDQAWNKYEYGLAKYVSKNRQTGKKKTGKNNIEYSKLKSELKARQTYIKIKVMGDGDQNGKKKLRGKKELPTYHAPNENEEYIVEMMLNSRVEKGKLDYLVLWDGWPLEWASWEPAKELSQARFFIKDFHKRFQNKPGDAKLKKYAEILAELGWDDDGEDNVDNKANRDNAASEVAETKKNKAITEIEAEEEVRDGAAKAIAKSDSNLDVSDLDLDTVDAVDAADEGNMEVDDSESGITTVKATIHFRLKNSSKSNAATSDAKTQTKKFEAKGRSRKLKGKIVSPSPTVDSKKRNHRSIGAPLPTVNSKKGTRSSGREEGLVMLPHKPSKYKPSVKAKKGNKTPYIEDTPNSGEDEIVMQPPAKRPKATSPTKKATTKVTKVNEVASKTATLVPEKENTTMVHDGGDDGKAAEDQLHAGLQAVATSAMATSSVVDDAGDAGDADIDAFKPAAEDSSSESSSSADYRSNTSEEL